MQKHIKKGEKIMSGKITNFLREYVFIISTILLIVGLLLFFMGIIWFFAKDLPLGFYTDIINNLEDWNFYILIVGFVALATGVIYLYRFIVNKKFLLEEIKTNKRSEFLKKHNELKNKIRHMPSKYRKILKDKEEELKIK
jgi:hypothetical protein